MTLHLWEIARLIDDFSDWQSDMEDIVNSGSEIVDNVLSYFSSSDDYETSSNKFLSEDECDVNCKRKCKKHH